MAALLLEIVALGKRSTSRLVSSLRFASTQSSCRKVWPFASAQSFWSFLLLGDRFSMGACKLIAPLNLSSTLSINTGAPSATVNLAISTPSIFSSKGVIVGEK